MTILASQSIHTSNFLSTTQIIVLDRWNQARKSQGLFASVFYRRVKSGLHWKTRHRFCRSENLKNRISNGCKYGEQPKSGWRNASISPAFSLPSPASQAWNNWKTIMSAIVILYLIDKYSISLWAIHAIFKDHASLERQKITGKSNLWTQFDQITLMQRQKYSSKITIIYFPGCFSHPLRFTIFYFFQIIRYTLLIIGKNPHQSKHFSPNSNSPCR